MPMQSVLFLAQRASALVLAPLVLVHLGLAIYAIHGGLSAAEILDRTQGNIFWMLFYGLFVVAAAVQAPIGLRNIMREWMGWNNLWLDGIFISQGLAILLLGMRAVIAVTGT